jgi:hypothetical protein
LDPEVQKQISAGKTEDPTKPAPEFGGTKSTERVGSGVSGSTGGSSGSLAGAGANGAGSGQGSLNGATPESLPVGTSVDMSTGGGGGARGPGSLSEASSEEESKNGAPFTKQPLLPAQAVAGLAKDVSNEFGPNLFSISTTVYRNMCAAGRLVHCTNKK